MEQMHREKACLIGLGLITQRYIPGLRDSAFLELCAVSDIHENAVSRPLYDQFPFYRDYQQMIREMKPAYVIISTPPESHFEIAAFCLQNGVNVIVEKPVTLCMADFDALTAMAQEKGLVFRTMFHWHGGLETMAFAKEYDLTQIQQIRVSVLDPYCADSRTINEDRRPLMGAWVDSGVNILSMIRLWLPFAQVELVGTEVQRCEKTGLPVYAKANLVIDGVPTEIIIDWRQGKNQKESFVKIAGRWVHINHSGQCIVDGGVMAYGRMDRMDQHYQYLFSTLEGKSNVEFSRSVHETLFKVGEAL